VIAPAIGYYELKRELLRANKTFSIGRLDEFINAIPGRYLPLSDEALRLAAELLAKSRQQGQPPADPKALDIDVIIAAGSFLRASVIRYHCCDYQSEAPLLVHYREELERDRPVSVNVVQEK
jgi:hypothetical protein